MSSIEELIGSSQIVVVGHNRYGGGWAAYIVNEWDAEAVQAILTSGDEDYASLAYGVIGAEWYPYVTADTPADAIAALEKRCAALLEVDWGGNGHSYYLENIMSAAILPDSQCVHPDFDGFSFNYGHLTDLVKDDLSNLIEAVKKENKEKKCIK